MILSDMGKVKIDGKRYLIKAELSTLIYALSTENLITKEEIEECVDVAFTPIEELKKEFNKEEFVEKLNKAIDELFGYDDTEDE